MNTDTIADFLTRIRNAAAAGHKVVEIPSSNIKKEMTKILYDQGYILNYKFTEGNYQGIIKIAIKYDVKTGLPVFRDMQRVSRPGLRQYKGSKELPRILNGLGIAIVSTSKGLMTEKNARKENIGGEVLCYVY